METVPDDIALPYAMMAAADVAAYFGKTGPELLEYRQDAVAGERELRRLIETKHDTTTPIEATYY